MHDAFLPQNYIWSINPMFVGNCCTFSFLIDIIVCAYTMIYLASSTLRLVNYSSYTLVCLFSPLFISSMMRRSFKVWFSICLVLFLLTVFWCHFQELIAKYNVMKMPSYASARTFKVLGLTFWSLIHYANFCSVIM